MSTTHQSRYQRRALHLALTACFAATTFAATPAFADVTSDLKAELAAQRARLEILEKKLEEASREASEAKATANKVASAPAPAPAASSGLAMPKGFAVYGIIDGGLENANYGQGVKNRVQSGMGSASRLGFKGERKFASSDLTAYFQLEAGVSIDNGQNTGHSSNISNPGGTTTGSSSSVNTSGVAVFSRNTFVGLKGNFGDLRFGRDYAPIYSITSASDPFTIGGATAFRLWSSAALSRFDNGLFYTTPSVGGVQASVAYSSGMENNTQTNVGLVN
ncbi:MAG TPA: porin, partial [Rhodocyclaceae bacterium]|nr:porin [Rhodocyclaceae bacterium]